MTATEHIRFFGMNEIDLVLFGCGMMIFFIYAWAEWGFSDFKKPAGCVLLLAPALFMAVESVTGFLTIDAAFNLLPEITNLSASDMLQFRLGAFRTSEMLLGPLVGVLKTMVDSPYLLAQLLKGLHWLAGFGLLLWIHRISRRLVTGNHTTYFILYMLVALTLPTNLLALKVFNYDKLSLLLGALGLFYMVSAWVDARIAPAVAGLVCLVLAAQEKLIVSPFLWMAMPVLAYLVASRIGPPSAVLRRCILASVLSVMIVLGISAGTTAVVAALRGSFAGLSPVVVLKPLEGILWPFLKSAMAVTSSGAALLLIVTSFLFTTIGALGLGGLKASGRCRDWADRFSEISFRPIYFGIAVMIGAAMVWTTVGQIYLGPAQSVTPGHYVPGGAFNETFWHFDAPTALGHRLRLIVAHYAIFVHAFPSALWLALAGLAWLEWRTPGASARRQPGAVILAVIALGILWVPLFYALTQTPATPRYFNLFIFIFVLTVLIRLIPYLTSRRHRLALLSFMIALVLVEVVPFRPVFSAFAPLWSREADPAFNRTFQIGRMGSISRWPGWGEAVMLAGRRIESSCAPDRCEAVHLHVAYPGLWLDPRHISTRHIDIIDPARAGYTHNDYFIVNRSSIIQNWTNFPQGVAPFAEVAFGNYVQAYVYRGDALNQAGFRFQSGP